MIGDKPSRLDSLRQRFGLTGETRRAYRQSYRPAGFRLEPHVELATGPEDRLAWVEAGFSRALLDHHENRAFAYELAEAFLRMLHGGAGLDARALLAVPGTEKPLSEGWLRSRNHKGWVMLLVAGPDVTICGSCDHPCPVAAARCPACGGAPRQSWWKRLRGG